jgi:hypothetical protein
MEEKKTLSKYIKLYQSEFDKRIKLESLLESKDREIIRLKGLIDKACQASSVGAIKPFTLNKNTENRSI